MVQQRRGRRGIRYERSELGFTLVELLVVVVILGVLATVTVFAVTGVSDRAEGASCAADRKTLEIALEAFRAAGDGSVAAAETDLIRAGFLRALSEYHDIVGGEIVAVPGNAAGCS